MIQYPNIRSQCAPFSYEGYHENYYNDSHNRYLNRIVDDEECISELDVIFDCNSMCGSPYTKIHLKWFSSAYVSRMRRFRRASSVVQTYADERSEHGPMYKRCNKIYQSPVGFDREMWGTTKGTPIYHSSMGDIMRGQGNSYEDRHCANSWSRLEESKYGKS